jgi:hypothetical protein
MFENMQLSKSRRIILAAADFHDVSANTTGFERKAGKRFNLSEKV